MFQVWTGCNSKFQHPSNRECTMTRAEIRIYAHFPANNAVDAQRAKKFRRGFWQMLVKHELRKEHHRTVDAWKSMTAKKLHPTGRVIRVLSCTCKRAGIQQTTSTNRFEPADPPKRNQAPARASVNCAPGSIPSSRSCNHKWIAGAVPAERKTTTSTFRVVLKQTGTSGFNAKRDTGTVDRRALLTTKEYEMIELNAMVQCCSNTRPGASNCISLLCQFLSGTNKIASFANTRSVQITSV